MHSSSSSSPQMHKEKSHGPLLSLQSTATTELEWQRLDRSDMRDKGVLPLVREEKEIYSSSYLTFSVLPHKARFLCYLTKHPKPKPSNAPAILRTCHSMSLDLGWTQPGKRLNHVLHLSRAEYAYSGSASDLCVCMGHTCFSTLFWGEGTHSERRKKRYP